MLHGVAGRDCLAGIGGGAGADEIENLFRFVSIAERHSFHLGFSVERAFRGMEFGCGKWLIWFKKLYFRDRSMTKVPSAREWEGS